MHFLRHIALFLASIALPQSVFAAAPKDFLQLAGELINILNLATLTLIIAGFVVYFWGISINILKFEDDPEKRKAYFFWGLLVLFVMVSIWGIIGLLQNTLFGGALFNPSTGGENPAGKTETPWNYYGIGGDT